MPGFCASNEVSLKAIALDQALKDTERLLGDKLDVVNSAVIGVPENCLKPLPHSLKFLATTPSCTGSRANVSRRSFRT